MKLASVIFFLLLPTIAMAQPAAAPTEQVTVTGQKLPPDVAISHFVESFKSGRWESAICPLTAGLPPKFTDFITQRVRAVASQVGAPVNMNASCHPNIEIVFTTTPQALLDSVRRDHPDLLGYHQTSRQAEEMATVTHTIQAWYTTATKDVNGSVDVDSGRAPLNMIRMPSPDPPGYVELNISASVKKISSNRLKPGLHTVFYNVIIVADPTKLVDHEIGALADYIAILSLARLNLLDICRPLPSVINLLMPDCEKSSQISENDLGYLRGLYTASADGMRPDEIAYDLKRSLEAGK